MKDFDEKKPETNTSDIVTESLQVSQIMHGITRDELDAINMQ